MTSLASRLKSSLTLKNLTSPGWLAPAALLGLLLRQDRQSNRRTLRPLWEQLTTETTSSSAQQASLATVQDQLRCDE